MKKLIVDKHCLTWVPWEPFFNMIAESRVVKQGRATCLTGDDVVPSDVNSTC